MGAPPQLTLEERRAALAKAAHSRKVRALFKAEIKSGKKHWLEAFQSSRKIAIHNGVPNVPSNQWLVYPDDEKWRDDHRVVPV